MVGKIKTDVDGLLLNLTMKKNFPIDFVKIELLSFFKSKAVHLHLFLSTLPFPKHWKQNFIYFGLKHVET